MEGMTVIEGRVGRDPEVRFTQKGVAVVGLAVAVTKRIRGQDGSYSDGPTTWWDVTCWRSLAEGVAEEIHRGDLVLIAGEAGEMETYEKRDGTPGVKLRLTARSVGRVPLSKKAPDEHRPPY